MNHAVSDLQAVLTVAVALLGFAGSLEKPLADRRSEPQPVAADGPTVRLQCVLDGAGTHPTDPANRRLLVHLASGTGSSLTDVPDAVQLRCRIAP